MPWLCLGPPALPSLKTPPHGADRRGAAQALLLAFLERHDGEVFLEVRASNVPAISLYRKLGFVEVGSRPGYYHSPVENALVMRSTIKIGKREPKSH